MLDLVHLGHMSCSAPEDVDGFTFTGRKFGGGVVVSRDGVEDEQILLHQKRV